MYRVARTSSAVPYKAIFYDKADIKGPQADEFIIYREIVSNLGRSFLLMGLAGLFFFTSDLRIMFIIAAVLSLAFQFFGEKAHVRLSFQILIASDFYGTFKVEPWLE